MVKLRIFMAPGFSMDLSHVCMFDIMKEIRHLDQSQYHSITFDGVYPISSFQGGF
jgi:hypothetical protein